MSVAVQIAGWWGLFMGTHMIQSHPSNRKQLVEKLGGEKNYAALYSIISFLTFIPMTVTYVRSTKKSPVSPWTLRSSFSAQCGAAAVGMAGGALFGANIGQAVTKKKEKSGKDKDTEEIKGVMRITRHPVFCSLGLLGISRMIVAPSVAGLVYWGGYPLFYLIGGIHQDYRKRPEKPEFYEHTSLLPFEAIIKDKNQFVPEEINIYGAAIGSAAALVITMFFARRPLPLR